MLKVMLFVVVVPVVVVVVIHDDNVEEDEEGEGREGRVEEDGEELVQLDENNSN
jgi:hypothetical protein